MSVPAHTPAHTIEASSSSPQLQLQQVSVMVRPSNHYLLQEIDLEIEVGDRLAIVGASGSGKTTLLRLLNRLSEPTSGSIFYQGQALQDYSVLQLRRQIMLMPQEPKLLGMTVQETLTYPLTLLNLPRPTVQERLKTWIQRFGIPDDWLNRTELQLSVGQRQWVSLARACLLEPAVLILDEPTSALDPGRITQAVQILREGAWTLVIASHQTLLLEKLCTRLLWLEAGGIKRLQSTVNLDLKSIQRTLEQQAQLDSMNWD